MDVVLAGSPQTLIAPVGEAAYDSFGWCVSYSGDVNGDGWPDVIVGSVGNDAGGNGAGRAYLYLGGPAADSIPDFVFTGEAAEDDFGYRVASAGDANGDNYDDVIVGALYNDAAGLDAGRVYMYFGGSPPDTTADLVFTPPEPLSHSHFGRAISGALDVNGDNYDDIIVGAEGRAYVYFGGAFPDTSVDVTLGEGLGTSVYFGYSVSGVGDVNGDDYADVIVGDKYYGLLETGKAYVFFGGSSVDSIPDVIFLGEIQSDDYGEDFGYFVSGAGDVNGDTFDDVIVTTHNIDWPMGTRGRVNVYFGGSPPDTAADLRIFGIDSQDHYGTQAAGAGDVNGDGFADWIIGGRHDTLGGWRGRACIYFGGTSPDTTADMVVNGEADLDRFGRWVSTARDVNGDGLDDVIVGAPYNDEGGEDAGRAYVISLSPSRTWNVPVDAPTIQAGIDSAAAGDTVLVACGIYHEHDIQVKSGICLRSETGLADCVTIEADSLGRVMACVDVDSTTRVEGFTLTDGLLSGLSTAGAGVYCSNSSVRISNCDISGNRSGEYGGGFYASGSPAMLLLTDCVVTDNWARIGGGVLLYSDATLTRCLIADNTVLFNGGGLHCEMCNVSLTSCTVSENSSGSSGGGISSSNTSLVLENTIVAFSVDGEALVCFGDSTPSVTCCDVYGNGGGDYVGCLAGLEGVDGNISGDPYFCDAAAQDYTVDAASPCLPENNGCAVLIGAYGEGCAVVSVPGVASGSSPSLFLSQAFPNPFSTETTIRFGLPRQAPVLLLVHDVAGREVAVLANELFPAGRHARVWNGRGADGHLAAAGVYFVRLTSEEFTAVRKVLRIR